MPAGRVFQVLGVRFSRQALFVSASALSLLPLAATAQAGPLENTSFISMYGGWAIQDSDPVVTPLSGSNQEVSPGDNGGMFGVEFGRPLSELADIRASVNATYLPEDEFGYSFDAGGVYFGETETTSTFAFQTLDLELGYRPGVLGNHVRVFGGPRILHASSDVDTFEDSNFKLGTYEHDVELWGAGARIGAEAAMPVTDRITFSLTGAGSIVRAHAESDLDYSDVTPAETGPTSADGWRTVYGLDAVASVDVAISASTSLQLGYKVDKSWNLTTTFPDYGAAAFEEGDLLTHGPVARITIKLP